jgi:AcrR family transcriptional regulator
MSPQRSNRAQLIEGTLRCLERLPAERITARAITEESGANLASITYHFGSKDDLVTAAIIEGLDRWLVEVERGLAELRSPTPRAKFRRAGEVIDASRHRRAGLVRNLFAALARAQHDARVREQLAAGFHKTRSAIASLLDLGDDQAGGDAGGLVLALFYGLLLQVELDPALSIEGKRMERAQRRLLGVLPTEPAGRLGRPRSAAR